MANNIYKAGVPSIVGVSNMASSNTLSAPVAAASFLNNAVSPVAGKGTYAGPNSNNGSTVVGVKMAGSLNANGVVTMVPGKNTPLS